MGLSIENDDLDLVDSWKSYKCWR